jgi:hypothetical protein
MSLGCGDSSSGCPGSRDGITGMNTKFPTCDDKGVFTDDKVCLICEQTFCKRFHISLSLIIKW